MKLRAMMGKMCQEIDAMVDEKRRLQEQKYAAVADTEALAQAAPATMRVLHTVEPRAAAAYRPEAGAWNPWMRPSWARPKATAPPHLALQPPGTSINTSAAA